jgi:hypothetical protein
MRKISLLTLVTFPIVLSPLVFSVACSNNSSKYYQYIQDRTFSLAAKDDAG